MVMSKECTIRAYGVRRTGTAKCSSIPVTHQRIDRGVSFPRVDRWFSADVQAFTAQVTVSDDTHRTLHFLIYFTHDTARYRESEAVLRNVPGRTWHGEFLVFRRALHSKKLVNVRARDHIHIWLAIKRLIADEA
ncbi:hypothetical protein BV25DRAFT_1843438 [Artomyces pyxidatus]|uniref:Uncharacterized protein n=1 Tax=Artomyces pyxidatus TaxID=48021 RepID=A0ACB8SE78_9AGAM|nr:hypothetical protein BV25DRAFT_1843438 [Artomyces pyxidatus]